MHIQDMYLQAKLRRHLDSGQIQRSLLTPIQSSALLRQEYLKILKLLLLDLILKDVFE